MRPEPELEWRIAGQMTGEDGPGAHAINLGREVSGEELEQLNAAIGLLQRLSATDAYKRAVQLLGTYVQECDEVGGREHPPPAALLSPLARSARAVIAAVARVPEHILTGAGECLAESDGELGELRERVGELEGSEAWRLAMALEQPLGDPRRLLGFEDGQLLVRAEPLEAMAGVAGAEADSFSSTIAVLLAGAVNVAQMMTARQLLACQEPIREASLLVRHLAAEVLIGAPALLGFADGMPPTGSTSFSHRALPLVEIAALQQALMRAPSLLGISQPEPAATDAEAPAELGEDAATAEDDKGDDVDEASSSGEQGGPGAEEAARAGEMQGAGVFGPPPPPAEPQPLDFGVLVDHLSRLPAETERAWSKALEADLLGESGQVLSAQWSSLLTAVYREVTDAEARLRARGIDPAMPAHPEDPALLQHLRLDGEPLDEWRALLVAQMWALIGVAKGIGGLTEPRAPFGLGGPDELTWWEAGAFALIRRRAAQLARVSTQLLEAARALAPSAPEDQAPTVPLTGPWRERLSLADEAVLRGDPEAAVLHLRLALRERAAQLGGMGATDLPGDLEERLARDPEFADLAAGLRLLREVGARLDQGRPVSLGFTLPVAELMLAPITRLCMSLSAALIRAARSEEPDASPSPEEPGERGQRDERCEGREDGG
jgi:hypothetical protein